MPLLHPKKTGRIFPRAPKDSLFSSSANLLVGLLKKKKERFVCGYIRAGSWIFNENRRYIYIYIPGISLSSTTALTTWDFFIWHHFYEGSTSIDQNIRIFPYVGKKRRFVDNTWKWPSWNFWDPWVYMFQNLLGSSGYLGTISNNRLPNAG